MVSNTPPMDGGSGDELERMLSPGAVRVVEDDPVPALDAAGADLVVVIEDPDDPRHRGITLSSADRTYRMFVEHMRDGAATVDSNGTILYANPRLAELLRARRESIVSTQLTEHIAKTVPIHPDELADYDGTGFTFEAELSAADGTTVPVLVSTSILEVDGDDLLCYTFTDLSTKKAQEREIELLRLATEQRNADLQAAQEALIRSATHDNLTELPNRALLIDRITQALSQAERSGHCCAVFFVDLDRFKQINDNHGHAAGDLVLRRVANQMAHVLRPMDTVARLGGDEFVVLAPEVDHHLHAANIAARLVVEIARRPGPGMGERVTASIGVAVALAGRATAESLLHEADTAMYHAKSLGGDRAEIFDTVLGERVHERSIAQRMLQSALDDRRVAVHYQPVVDLTSGSVTGFEALARLSEPDGNMVSPAAFIPVAEDSGLVVPLGAQVLHQACAEAATWEPLHPASRPPTIAVNLSARQFAHGDLPSIVQNCVAETGLAPDRLHFELTETAVIDLRPDVVDQLGQIRDMGVEIGLDDFGTGYASLTHLRRLPLSFVKIDRSFVQGVGANREDERIVVAVVDLAAALGLRSIAEGIETLPQLEALREIGCDQAQGYLLGRPAPVAVTRS